MGTFGLTCIACWQRGVLSDLLLRRASGWTAGDSGGAWSRMLNTVRNEKTYVGKFCVVKSVKSM